MSLDQMFINLGAGGRHLLPPRDMINVELCGGDGLVTKLCQTLCSLVDVTRWAPLPMGFPRQEYWSGLTLPSLVVVYCRLLKYKKLLFNHFEYRFFKMLHKV